LSCESGTAREYAQKRAPEKCLVGIEEASEICDVEAHAGSLWYNMHGGIPEYTQASDPDPLRCEPNRIQILTPGSEGVSISPPVLLRGDVSNRVGRRRSVAVNVGVVH